MMNLFSSIFAFYTPGPLEIGALAVIGLLLFGRRLPQVGRNLGRSIVEFKKGVKGMTEEIENASNEESLEGPDREILPPRDGIQQKEEDK